RGCWAWRGGSAGWRRCRRRWRRGGSTCGGRGGLPGGCWVLVVSWGGGARGWGCPPRRALRLGKWPRGCSGGGGGGAPGRGGRGAGVGVWGAPGRGTAARAGRDLPAAEVIAADKRITAAARWLRGRGARGGMDWLRSRAYLGFLTGYGLDDLLARLLAQGDGGRTTTTSTNGQGQAADTA